MRDKIAMVPGVKWGPHCRAYRPDRGWQLATVWAAREARTREARDRWEHPALDERLGLARPGGWVSPPGAPRRFRSEWERRLAEALNRLEVPWEYEPDGFDYHDASGGAHTYTPDFRLVPFSRTYVEVKGPAGASAPDKIKMSRVMAEHPRLTLLLWGPPVIEYLEDIADPGAVVGLLSRTAA